MFIDVMIAKAKTDRKTIVLPEGNDERVLGGAEKALAAGIADLIILGDEKDPKVANYNLAGATFIIPATSPLTAELAQGLYECRKHKGMTPEQAAYNRYAPTLMSSVDTDTDLCRRERFAILQRLGAGDWQIFGAHGMKKDYKLKMVD